MTVVTSFSELFDSLQDFLIKESNASPEFVGGSLWTLAALREFLTQLTEEELETWLALAR